MEHLSSSVYYSQDSGITTVLTDACGASRFRAPMTTDNFSLFFLCQLLKVRVKRPALAMFLAVLVLF